MRYRIFIAINLPQEIKIALFNYQKKWLDMFTPYRTEGSGAGPARWTKAENLHITLAFIGYTDDEGVGEIKNIVSKVVEGLNPFSLVLNKICYGPLQLRSGQTREIRDRGGTGEGQSLKSPRMIWAVAEESAEFASLCDKLNGTLATLPKIRFKPEDRESIPHITLARIKEWEWRRIEPDERPEIREYIDFKIPVNSIELMESVLKRTGSEYKILETYSLGK